MVRKASHRRESRTSRLLGEKGTLAGRASRALSWSFLSTLLGKFGLMGFSVLLARLLGPHQFGAAAVAYVALLAVTSINDLGVSLAIVRWPGEPGEIASTVASISVVTSLLLYVSLFFGAPAFAAAMGAPGAASVVRVLGLNLVIGGIIAVPAALLERYFRQDRKMIADQVWGWLGAVVSVVLAGAGLGAMSLAIGQVVGALTGGILIVIFSPLPLRFGLNVGNARKLLRFGLPLAGSSFIVFLVGNVDNLVVGHMLGATILGFYVLAWNLSNWPVTIFSQPVRSVAPAMFSRLQHDPVAMRTSFVSAAALLGTVTLPVCFLLSGAAVPLVGFMYGLRWLPAAQALVWLALLGELRIAFEFLYDYFVVLARSRVVFTVQLVWLMALIPALVSGASLAGVRGAAVAGVTVAAFVVLPSYLIEVSRAGIRLRTLAARLWLPLGASIGVAVCAAAVSKLISNELAALAVAGVIALATIGLLCRRMRSVIAELRPVLAVSEGLEPVSSPNNAGASGPVSAATAVSLGPPGSPDPVAQRDGLEALLRLAVAAPSSHSARTRLSARGRAPCEQSEGGGGVPAPSPSVSHMSGSPSSCDQQILRNLGVPDAEETFVHPLPEHQEHR